MHLRKSLINYLYHISKPVIDENVVNINLLHSDDNKLFGLARNQISYMRSDDGGDNWCAILDEGKKILSLPAWATPNCKN